VTRFAAHAVPALARLERYLEAIGADPDAAAL
jgi:hypothetical protein